MNMDPTCKEIEDSLPPPPKAAGLYKPLLVEGNLAYFSGHLPIQTDGSLITGKIGSDLTVEQGYEAARQVGLNILATVREVLGGLDRVERVVKILGMVNAASGFTQHPQVINGCSELFREVWGTDHGVGARSAYGVSDLPAGVAVEIEGIFKVKN
jgi:enamine deaminase RidA (YjgF/YER057c/UK114 family)